MASFGTPGHFWSISRIFQNPEKVGHFDLEPDFNNFPEIPSSGNLTTQITVWVNTIVFTGLLFRKNRPGPSYSSGPTKAQIGTFQTVQTVEFRNLYSRPRNAGYPPLRTSRTFPFVRRSLLGPLRGPWAPQNHRCAHTGWHPRMSAGGRSGLSACE